MSGQLPISIPTALLADVCRRHGVARLSLFGSVLRSDFTPKSDVDVLVEFVPGTHRGFFGFQDLEDELSRAFGRKVDLNTPRSLSVYFVERVRHEARPLYVAA